MPGATRCGVADTDDINRRHFGHTTGSVFGMG
jgi:hypothetical protein